MLQRDKLFDGVYGLAIGDALGVPVEFMTREEISINPVKGMREYGSHNQPKGTWSDDTSMVLATLDALCAGSISTGRIMNNFSKWLTEAKYTAGGTVFDIGGTCYRAIKTYMAGEPIELCGETEETSNGNGSLMRMLPMVYYIYLKYGMRITPASVNCIYEVSGLTHAHIISKMCCVYYVYIGIYLMLFGDQRGLRRVIADAIRAVEDYYFTVSETPAIYSLISLDSFTDSLDLDREDVNSTGYVVDSLEASIWCLANTSSYEDAVLLAVNLGGDTDTIGAITGSLAGLYYGMESIPVEWVADLKNKGLINDICKSFYELYK